MLLQNKSFLTCNGLRYLAGAPAVSGVIARSLLGGTVASQPNRYIGQANFYKGDATPSGYNPTSGAWYPNRKIGGMASRYLLVGSGEVSDNSILAGGLNGSVNMIGSGYINTLPFMKIADHFIVDVASLTSLGKISSSSTMSGLLQFIPSDNIVLAGHGNIPDVMLKILAWSISSISALGGLTGDVKQKMILRSDLTGEGDIDSPSLSLLIKILSSITGTGGITTPNLKATANLISDLVGEATISDVLLKTFAICISSLEGEGELEGSLKTTVALISHVLGQGNVSYAGLIGLVYLLENACLEPG